MFEERGAGGRRVELAEANRRGAASVPERRKRRILAAPFSLSSQSTFTVRGCFCDGLCATDSCVIVIVSCFRIGTMVFPHENVE